MGDGVKIEMIPTPAAKRWHCDSLILKWLSATGASGDVSSKRGEVVLRQCVDCKMGSLIGRQEIGIVIVKPVARFFVIGSKATAKTRWSRFRA